MSEKRYFLNIIFLNDRNIGIIRKGYCGKKSARGRVKRDIGKERGIEDSLLPSNYLFYDYSKFPFNIVFKTKM